MAKKKIRRSSRAHYRKMIFAWIISLFFLALLVVLDFIIVYNQVYPPNKALDSEIDFSKIHFNGLSLGEEINEKALQHRVVDADYDYSYEDISISVDDNNIIDRLAFYATTSGEGGVTINDVAVDYRGYPLKTISDFVTYFGMTKVTNFNHFKYLSYRDGDYVLDITLFKGDVYNVILSKNAIK